MASPDRERAALLQSQVAALEELLSEQERTVAEQSERLVSAREKALAATAAKSKFLANMSHELRTPLNSVIGFANILLKNKTGNLNQQQITYLERIQANGTHLLELINSILDLSKIEAGRVDVSLEAVALDDLAKEIVELLRGQVPNDVELVADIPVEFEPIQTDPGKLKQIIINLLGNALRFTERGSVTLRIEAAAGDRRPTHIEIADTGIGIPKDKINRVFEAFEQAESSTSRRFGGTGLGLAISKSLCDLMGYRIEVDSEVDRGSTFRIVLTHPSVTSVPEPRSAIAPSPAADKPRDLSVLVIDDDADARLILTEYLEDLGAVVIAVGSGEEGLHLARARKPGLIMLDLMMPGMDGWEVLHRLKTDPKVQDIPVIVVSMVAGEQNGSVLGAVELLNKPVTRDQVESVVSRISRKRTPTVLMVEDNEDTRMVLRDYLLDVGCEVLAAGNGREALEVLENVTPDLITLDLLMPEMDGLAFLGLLRKDARFLNVPVIVLTAKDLSGAEKELLARQARAVLSKGEAIEDQLKSLVSSLFRDRSGLSK